MSTLSLSIHSAVKMLHASVLYKLIIDIHTDTDISDVINSARYVQRSVVTINKPGPLTGILCRVTGVVGGTEHTLKEW